MSVSRTKAITTPASWLLACLLWAVPAGAESTNFLTLGMKEYNAGDYTNASGHLGAALNTEFNNPVLHYYMASCYVHMNQKDAAVREFRIAYALQPDGDAGKLSKLALKYYGIDSGSDAPTKDAKATAGKDPKTGLPAGGNGTASTSSQTAIHGTTGTTAAGTGGSSTTSTTAAGTRGNTGAAPGVGSTAAGVGSTATGAAAGTTGSTVSAATNSSASHAPAVDKMLSTVQDQLDREKRLRLEASQRMADQTKQQGSSYIDKTANEIKENMRTYFRGRFYDPTSLPDDARALLDRLKTGYDNQRAANLRAGNAQAAELDRSAQNLQDLLNEKPRPGQPQLQPVGTSLYVRNYSLTPDSKSNKPPQTPSK